jgi:outer membrane lipopolysaccharide assembly protein LptE/RlpB
MANRIARGISSALISVGVSIALAGCGYTLQGSGSVLPPDIKVVSIPIVENNTTEPSLTPLLTEALRDRFERFGVVQVVDDLGGADAVLQARIINVNRKTKSVTSNTSTALEYDTTLTVGAVLKRVTGEVLWKVPAMQATRSFGTTSGVVVTSSSDFFGGGLGSADLAGLDTREISRGQEQEAFTTLTDDMARRIYDESVSPDF